MSKTLRAYHRQNDGTLEIIDIEQDDDGQYTDSLGYPLKRTDETATLKGWPDEGQAHVYLNEGGREILVPDDPMVLGLVQRLEAWDIRECELCGQNETTTPAVAKVWADEPFGNAGSRYVALCEDCIVHGWTEEAAAAWNKIQGIYLLRLRNDFHNSLAACSVSADGWITPKEVTRVRKALCGIESCTCGGNLGERGRQKTPFVVDDVDPVKGIHIEIVGQ